MAFEPGKTVHFPKHACAACPLRQRCTTSGNGRSVAIPDEALLAELRERQATPAGRARLRERVKAGHALAHVGHWQGRRARYRGTRKNLFDLRRIAVVHNLHVIARQPATNWPHDHYLTGALAVSAHSSQPGPQAAIPSPEPRSGVRSCPAADVNDNGRRSFKCYQFLEGRTRRVCSSPKSAGSSVIRCPVCPRPARCRPPTSPGPSVARPAPARPWHCRW
jgi:hypothetical protein